MRAVDADEIERCLVKAQGDIAKAMREKR